MRTQFLTTALWGVGSTAPYGHDGRSMTLKDVILRHGGEAQSSATSSRTSARATAGASWTSSTRSCCSRPDDVASNLDPGDPDAAGYPQQAHGRINLGALFNNPSRSGVI